MIRYMILLLLLSLSGPLLAGARILDLAVLEDPNGRETIQSISSPARTFRPLADNTFAGGFTRSIHWFRLRIDMPAGEWWLELLPPVLDELHLYEPDPDAPSSWRIRTTGDSLPFSAREVRYRGFIFKLSSQAEGLHTYYLRLQTTSTSILLPRIWAADEFADMNVRETALLTGGISVILTVFLLNLNTWLWLRDHLTLWFLVTLVGLVSYSICVSGFLQQYLTPHLPSASYYMIATSSLMLIGFGNGLYRRLFELGRDRPLLFWLYEVTTWLPMLALVPAMFGYYTEIIPIFNTIAIPMLLLGLWLAFGLWREKKPGGGMMLIANVFSLMGILYCTLGVLGVINGGFLAWYSLQIGSLGNILALQLALGSRTRALRDARIQAEEEASHERQRRMQQGQFLSMLAHELRTALAVLKMALGSQPMTPRAIASAERAMAGMSEVIERSIQLEKFTDNSQSIERSACEVADLLETVIASSLAPERIRLHLENRPEIHTDSKLLRVIMSNLVDNALKYGDPHCLVDIRLSGVNPFVLEVCNPAGPVGVPDPERVFDKYYRAPLAHGLTGSGLGLHIAQTLSQMLGGNLSYHPQPDQVCFQFSM